MPTVGHPTDDEPAAAGRGTRVTSTPAHASVLLIGASRGLGLAIAAEYVGRGATVVATVRGEGRTALHDLWGTSGGLLEIEHLDITVPEQVHALRQRLGSRTFDLLFVNAGVGTAETDVDVTTDEFVRLMVTNALSPMRVVEALGDVVPADGTIAIMSSGPGSIANNHNGHYELYRASKSALNQLMRSYAARHHDDPRALLLMAPGWVKTDLGGPDARLTVEESIPNLVRTVDAQRGHAGLQYLDYQGQRRRLVSARASIAARSSLARRGVDAAARLANRRREMSAPPLRPGGVRLRVATGALLEPRRIARSLRTALHTELAEQVRHVVLHRLL